MVQKSFQSAWAIVLASLLTSVSGHSAAKDANSTKAKLDAAKVNALTNKPAADSAPKDPLFASPVREGTMDIFHLDQDGAKKLNCYVTILHSYDINGCDGFGNIVISEHYSYDKMRRSNATRTDRSSEFVAGEVLKRLIARGTCRSNSEGMAWLGNSSTYSNPCERDYYEHKSPGNGSGDSSGSKKEKVYY